MNGLQWLLFIGIIQLIHFGGTYKLYQKAGRKSWEALVPIYNAYILMKIIGRPTWWVILLFIPIINLLMFPVVWIETIRSFGKNTQKDTWLVVLTLGLYTYAINNSDVSYVENRSLNPRTALGEWVSSIVFAIVAASIVHAYFIQPFVIPTGSLERTLLVGDFLLVSKYHYGARVPMTPIAAPMVHDTLPIIGTKSYLKKPQLPYLRLPGITSPKRNDKVVFNWPIDTVRFFRDPSNIRVDKPIDKKSNYVKRLVGLPGDQFSIIDGKIHIDGEPLVLDERAKPQINYTIYAQKGVSSKLLIEAGVKEFMRTYSTQNLNQTQANALYMSGHGVYNNPNGNGYLITTMSSGIDPNLIRSQGLALSEIIDKERNASLTEQMAQKLLSYSSIDSVVKQLQPKGQFDASIYPHSRRLPWNVDQMGPFTIPSKDFEIELNPTNIDLYKEVITQYEGHELSQNGTQVLIDGETTTSYRFEKDYYWMMGDNRHNSEDSRYWGFVPEDHILGKPIFIWMSIDGINDGISNWKIRWDRVFTTVDGEGTPRSYFKHFLAILILGYGVDYYRKRKKNKKAQ